VLEPSFSPPVLNGLTQPGETIENMRALNDVSLTLIPVHLLLEPLMCSHKSTQDRMQPLICNQESNESPFLLSQSGCLFSPFKKTKGNQREGYSKQNRNESDDGSLRFSTATKYDAERVQLTSQFTKYRCQKPDGKRFSQRRCYQCS
jgi:hypothetical protein